MTEIRFQVSKKMLAYLKEKAKKENVVCKNGKPKVSKLLLKIIVQTGYQLNEDDIIL